MDNRYAGPFLDGVGAAVIGLLILTSFQFVLSVVDSGVDAVAFLLPCSILLTNTLNQSFLLSLQLLVRCCMSNYSDQSDNER